MLAPRSVAAALGLLAFSVTIFAGLWVHNPVIVTLSRAVTAMVIFVFIGLVTGWAAQTVVREHVREREAALFTSEETKSDEGIAIDQRKSSTGRDAEPMGT